MILEQGRQWVREAMAPHLEEDYRVGDTLLDLTIEANRSFLAENLRLEDLPLLEVRENFLIENHEFDNAINYKEFDLKENTRVRTQLEILDVSANKSYRAQMFPSQAEVQKLSEQIGSVGVDQVRDIIPIYRNGNVCQIYDSVGPTNGWEVSVDFAILSVVKQPTPLSNVDLPRRLKDDHELYALKLAYADVMSTLIGDVRYKDIRVQILGELGLQK